MRGGEIVGADRLDAPTWPAVRGARSDPTSAVRTSSSLNTLQEQMIMVTVLGRTGTI